MTTAPKNAVRCLYMSSNGRKGTFYVWPSGKVWYWEALGNNGEEATEQLAAEAAKRWIRDG